MPFGMIFAGFRSMAAHSSSSDDAVALAARRAAARGMATVPLCKFELVLKHEIITRANSARTDIGRCMVILS